MKSPIWDEPEIHLKIENMQMWLFEQLQFPALITHQMC